MILDPTSGDRLLTRRQVAERYGVRTDTVKRWSSRGVAGLRLPCLQVAGVVRISECALVEWLAAVARRRAWPTKRIELPGGRSPARWERDQERARARLAQRLAKPPPPG